MILKRLYLWGVMFLIPGIVESYEHFEVKYSHATCKIFNAEMVFNLSCTSRIINRTRRASSDINLQPGIELDNVYVMITFYYKFGTIYRPHLIKIEQELCQFLKDSTTSKVFETFSSTWRKNGNFLDPCPIKGRRYLKDAETEVENFPIQVLPAGDWRIDSVTSSIINNTKIKLFLISEYLEVKTKGAFQWKK